MTPAEAPQGGSDWGLIDNQRRRELIVNLKEAKLTPNIMVTVRVRLIAIPIVALWIASGIMMQHQADVLGIETQFDQHRDDF